MTAGKELRESFDQLKRTSNINEQQTNASAAIGILASQMTDTITDDISEMIERNRRQELDGYISCLSRIMNKKIAWKCILQGYAAKNEKVPTQYAAIFQAEITSVPPPHSIGM